MKAAGKRANGATLYVTLEPCCHHGKTPPCTKAIMESGIKRVVYATQDPHRLVCGKGCRDLYAAGIKLDGGVLEVDARELNEMFFKDIKTGMPFVLAKAALSADGKIAAKDGSSQWITGEKARERVQALRNSYDAVMAGAVYRNKGRPAPYLQDPGRRKPNQSNRRRHPKGAA